MNTSRNNTGILSPKISTTENMKSRLGMTEQMEKYISHDLGLIEEEAVGKKKKESLTSVINLQYLKSRDFDPRTTARLTHDFKFSRDHYEKMKH